MIFHEHQGKCVQFEPLRFVARNARKTIELFGKLNARFDYRDFDIGKIKNLGVSSDCWKIARESRRPKLVTRISHALPSRSNLINCDK